MATNWSKESTTKASSTGSTTSTSFQLDSGESFLVKNSSSSNIMSLAESSGNLDVTGTINLGSSSYMTLNNNEIDVSSGDLTVDVAGDILLDAAGSDIKFQVGGTSYLTWNAGGILKMLYAGDTNDYFQINVGGGHGATTISTVDVAGTNAALTLDVDGNILFDTATNEINLKDNGTYFARFKNVGTNLEIQSGASSTTALTFSGANATFAGNLTVSGGITVAGASAFDIGDSDKLLLGDSDDFQLYHDGSNSYITNSTGALKLATESSGIAISIGHTTSETTINDNLTVTGTTSINGASIGVDSDSVLAQSTGTGTSNTLFGKNAGDSIASGGNLNTLFGEDAGTAISTGDSNTCIGYRAGYDLEGAGASNTLVGVNTGSNITTGLYNVCVGQVAGLTMTTTTGTVLLGYNAGGSIDSADANYTVAIGYNSMSDLEEGASNTAVGQSAGKSITTGDLNVAIGTDAMKGAAAITGVQNVAIGALAGYDMTGDCAYNVLIGASAGTNLTTSDYNTIIGASAGLTLTTAANNTFIGYQAGTLTTGANNTLIGYQAGDEIAAGIENVALGALALSNADNHESRNTAVGYSSLEDLDGDEQHTYNTAVGYGSGKELTTGIKNTHIGALACGNGLQTGDYNSTLGYAAGYSLTSGAGNTFLGVNSGYTTDTGLYNTSIGYGAFQTNIDGDSNTAVGYQALHSFEADADGHGSNTVVGKAAGQYCSTGTDNTFIGANAGRGIDVAGDGSDHLTGDSNVCIGYSAGILLQGDADQNVLIGFKAGENITVSDSNIFIGANSGNTTVNGHSNIMIGHNCETSATDSTTQYVLGINLNATANDAVFIGDADDHIRCDWATDSTWDKVSDKRKKNVLGESPLGLDFINDLNTVQFTFKAPSEYPEEWTSYNKDKKEPRNTEVQHGLLAQDVKKAMDNADVETFSGWSEDPDGCQRIGESAFVIPLIKAVQELSKKVEELENKEK